MSTFLDTPNPAMPPDQLNQIATNNTAKIQSGLNGLGINQSLLIENTTAYNFSSATLTQLLNMSGVVTSSGGYFEINFKVNFTVPAANDFICKLLIDGVIKDSFLISSVATGANNQNGTLAFRGTLGIGRHTITVQSSLNGGGTAVISDSLTMTRLQAVEFLLNQQ